MYGTSLQLLGRATHTPTLDDATFDLVANLRLIVSLVRDCTADSIAQAMHPSMRKPLHRAYVTEGLEVCQELLPAP